MKKITDLTAAQASVARQIYWVLRRVGQVNWNTVNVWGSYLTEPWNSVVRQRVADIAKDGVDLGNGHVLWSRYTCDVNAARGYDDVYPPEIRGYLFQTEEEYQE